jgi:hypothetical protein
MGWDADAELLKSMGVDAEHLDSGCCGLAGNFGFEPGHREVSEACAEQVLLPRIREAEQQTLVLADGFSCRTQIDELDSGGRRALHLAEVLAAAQHDVRVEPGGRPEDTYGRRPEAPTAPARAACLGVAAAGLTGAAALLARRLIGTRSR